MSVASHFNIVAFPEDYAIRHLFFQAAKLFVPKADHYILAEDGALPHATLCQFQVENPETAMRLARQFTGQPLHLKITSPYVVQSADEDPGKFWTGYTVKSTPELLALHASIVKELRGRSAEIFGATGNAYSPHFTVARTDGLPLLDGNKDFDRQLIGRDIPCRIELGRSDEMGQLLEIVKGPV